MNFLDSIFDKIPFLKDMDRSKRPIIAGFAVFAVMVLLGIIIDAIAGSGGGITVVFIIIGFLLMAAVILADYFLTPKVDDQNLNAGDNYEFFDELNDDANANYNVDPNAFQRNAYPDEMQQPQFEINQQEYDDPPVMGNGFDNYGNVQDDGFADNMQYGYEDNYDPRPESIPYGSEFQFTDEPETIAYQTPVVTTDPVITAAPEINYPPVRENYDHKPNDTILPQNDYSHRNFRDDVIGKPVMTFGTAPTNVSNDIAGTAERIAPHISAPVMNDHVGGPVMSIPMRSQDHIVSEPAPKQPEYSAPTYQREYSAPSASSGRGQEIESFFDNMSEDELLYSDCVEVWASDAKPAAVRLLKQIESMPDKKKADALGREAEYVNAMLDRIYYFTMMDSIKDNLTLKKYNFSAMVKECLRRFSPFFMEKRIGLLWKGLDIDIVTDKRWLIFALTQVIFNAVEFTGLGGKIAISAKKEGSMIHLMVDDNGCGISDEDLPHIFMAGFMGDNVPNESGRRTGMGLFITRSVVEKLGGTVTAESSIDKGTRISIILPEKP